MRQDPFIHLDTPRDGIPKLETEEEITREDLIAQDAQYNGKYKPRHAYASKSRPSGWILFERATRRVLVIMVITIAVLFVFGYLKK